jgi:hypothetical protein
MKSPKIAANQISNAQMPKSVRKAFEAAANVAWVAAQKLAHENVDAARRIEIAASKSHMEEILAVSAAQPATILGLRLTLAKAEAAASVATEEAARATRQLSEEASRAENVAIQAEILRSTLQAAQISAQALFAEIDAGQQARWLREEADLIAAVSVLIKAACRRSRELEAVWRRPITGVI